jgi:hypothetical protein
LTPLEAALTYASWGWPVLMLQPNSKLPATAHGVKDATTDEATIRGWFAERPFANVGIAAGSASGLVVYDIDPRNGGSDSWEAWQAEHGKVPDGAMQLTAGGGVHHLAAYVEGVRSTKLRDGIDLLSDGRYFVAFPSVVGGRQYTWELSSDPFDGVAPFAIPDSWRSVAPRTAPTRAGVSLLTGSRNDGLTALAGAMRHHGMSSDEILAALLVTNETRCDVPLPLSEVRQIAAGIGRYEPETDTAANGAMANEIAEGFLASEEARRTSRDEWLIPAEEFCAQPAPIAWLVRGWIQDRALCMVHGPSGGGKTFAVLDWALRIASGGGEWCGARVAAGPVVYLAGEGHAGLRGRVKAWMQHHGVDQLNLWLSRAGCDLDTHEGYERVADSIRRKGIAPRLIVVDTLHRFLSGDENSSQDARRMLDACARLMTEFGCAIILVHHTGVSDEAQHRARGSSAWRGALEIEISVVPGKPGEPIQIVQRKAKDSELVAPVAVELLRVTIEGWLDEDGEPVTSAVTVRSDSVTKEKPKADSKVTSARKMFEDAFFLGGMEQRDGLPYVTRAAFRAYLEEHRGLSPASATQCAKPTAAGKPICLLLDGGIIEAHADGWRMVESEHAVALRLRSVPAKR